MLNEQMRCVQLEFGTCGSDPAAEGDCASYDHLPDARLPRSVLLARSCCVLAAGSLQTRAQRKVRNAAARARAGYIAAACSASVARRLARAQVSSLPAAPPMSQSRCAGRCAGRYPGSQSAKLQAAKRQVLSMGCNHDQRVEVAWK